MKRKRLSRDLWTRIAAKRVCLARADFPEFRGWACRLDMLAVPEPSVWRRRGADVPVCAAGSRWLGLLPQDDFYCVTAMLAPDGEILLWYIDLIAGQGVDPDGTPWFDDLYLDLLVWPDGEVNVDDRDELDAALAEGDITAAQHALALETAARLCGGTLGRPEGLRALTEKCLALFEDSSASAGRLPQDKAEDTHG